MFGLQTLSDIKLSLSVTVIFSFPDYGHYYAGPFPFPPRFPKKPMAATLPSARLHRTIQILRSYQPHFKWILALCP
jgi:hypothetical protein